MLSHGTNSYEHTLAISRYASAGATARRAFHTNHLLFSQDVHCCVPSSENERKHIQNKYIRKNIYCALRIIRRRERKRQR